MQVAKTLAIGLFTFLISSIIWADEMSNQMMMCELDGKEFLITVPMPDEWSEEKRKETCTNICNSMKLTNQMHIITSHQKKKLLKKQHRSGL